MLRRQAHRLRQEGRTWGEIAWIAGVHLTTVMKWSRRFQIGAPELGEVVSDKRGRRLGENRTLNAADEWTLRDLIIGGSPSQISLPFALWSRKTVQAAIKIKWGVDMPIRAWFSFDRFRVTRASASGPQFSAVWRACLAI